MSGLTTALAAFASSPVSASVVDAGVVEQAVGPCPFPSSPQPAIAQPQPKAQSIPSASSLSLVVPIMPHRPSAERPNEHLAVLLPKHLWKPDSVASACDNFFCRVKFGLFERRHHCRKCGGVYCHSCTSQTISLLDVSNLPFSHPPPGVPLSSFESPTSPITESRVCDDCWDQIHGCPSNPRTPDLVRHSSPISMFQEESYFNSSGSSSFCSEVATPLGDDNLNAMAPISRRQSLRTKTSNSSLQSTQRHIRSSRTSVTESERSYGELDAYPLRRASVLCKASGGGRWQPKQATVLVGYRQPVPGGKAPYEVQLELDEELEKARRDNPIIRDGAFQLRFPRAPEPVHLSRSFQLSTF